MSSPLDPSPFLAAYERGTQGIILSNATGTNAQSGTAAPVGSVVFGIAPSRANDQLSDQFVAQIDVGSGSPSAFSVTFYGSLNGVNFYSIGSAITSVGISKIVSDFPFRYITASITALDTGGLTISFAA